MDVIEGVFHTIQNAYYCCAGWGVLSALCSCCGRCAKNNIDPKKDTEPYAPVDGYDRPALPVFRQPDLDDGPFSYIVEEENRLKKSLKLTIWWPREIHPICCVHWVYLWARMLCCYGRSQDNQSITIHYADEQMQQIVSMSSWNWGHEQKWSELIPKHYGGTYEIEAFQDKYMDGRPVVYVNTWNHCFGVKDTNPDMSKHDFAHYELSTLKKK